ncbi:hypothetical protein LPJ53_005798 [Coemansia erecta]|uniref:Uncharacterized protein n=1 Tax=Coemansia erecta TaxID=147472 RepID=A0A9W7XW17_9FUNG|nr:hypothetical protein LPJ53_005798 [Coemansia erecta]
MAPRFTAFVHDHPALASLRSTQWAERFELTTVDPTTFSPHEQLALTPRFVVIAHDHLSYHNRAHNITNTFPYGSSAPTVDLVGANLTFAHALLQEAAKADARPPPLLCFTDKQEFARNSVYAGIFRSLFAVEHYARDCQGAVDFGALREVAEQRLAGSGRDMFLVKVGDSYSVHCLGSSVSCTLTETSRMIAILRAGLCSFDDIPDIDGRKPRGQQTPGFRLCDRSGVLVAKDCRFWLQICLDSDDPCDDKNDGDSDNAGERSADTRCLRLGSPLSGGTGSPGIFSHATVDGITYLMAGGQYLHVNDAGEITLTASLPGKSSRLQLEYNYRGDIMLAKWGGSVFATCEFGEDALSTISFKLTGPNPADEIWPMALRLHRITALP